MDDKDILKFHLKIVDALNEADVDIDDHAAVLNDFFDVALSTESSKMKVNCDENPLILEEEKEEPGAEEVHILYSEKNGVSTFSEPFFRGYEDVFRNKENLTSSKVLLLRQ